MNNRKADHRTNKVSIRKSTLGKANSGMSRTSSNDHTIHIEKMTWDDEIILVIEHKKHRELGAPYTNRSSTEDFRGRISIRALEEILEKAKKRDWDFKQVIDTAPHRNHLTYWQEISPEEKEFNVDKLK